MFNIPKDKNFPPDAVQCDSCGGWGCVDCNDRGWYAEKFHHNGRRCLNEHCCRPLEPHHVAVYCSNYCAEEDNKRRW